MARPLRVLASSRRRLISGGSAATVFGLARGAVGVAPCISNQLPSYRICGEQSHAAAQSVEKGVDVIVTLLIYCTQSNCARRLHAFRAFSIWGCAVLEISADVARLERALTDVALKQLPFAISMALNDTAKGCAGGNKA